MKPILLVLLALASEPDKAAEQAAPPEIRLANSAADIDFGVSIILDTTPSKAVHRMKWSVWPEKYEGNLVEIAPGKTLFTCTLPGRYVFYGAASNKDGDLVTLRHSVRILPPGQELLDAMRREAEGVRATPAVFERPETPRQAIQQPEAIPGLRGELTALLGKVESINIDAERLGAAAGYDRVATELLAKRPTTEEQSLAIVSRALDNLDPPIRDKWRPFSQGLREVLSKRAKEGELPDYVAYAKACQVVEGLLGEGR